MLRIWLTVFIFHAVYHVVLEDNQHNVWDASRPVWLVFSCRV